MANNTKSETKSDSDSELTQFAEFGGVAELDISIRIPCSFYEAVKEYSKIADISPREWFNDAVIDMIQSIELRILNQEYAKKYHLLELSREKGDAMVQAQSRFNLSEETLSDAGGPGPRTPRLERNLLVAMGTMFTGLGIAGEVGSSAGVASQMEIGD